MKNGKMKKAAAALSCACLLLFESALSVSADMEAGLESAKDTLLTSMTNIIGNVVVPIGMGVATVVFLFNLMQFLKQRREGEGYRGTMVTMGITIAIDVLLGTWSIWGKALLS